MISVIVPCFNAGPFLERCTRSIASTCQHGGLDLLFVDDASTEFQPDLRSENCRTLRNETNLGFVRTANRGAGEAKGEILVFLNQDTEFITPGWDEELRRVFAGRPEVGIVGAKLIYPDSGLVQFAGGCLDGEEWKSDYLYYRADPDDPRVNRPRSVDWVLGAFLAVRRELFEKLGGFSSIYHSTYEDIDLCLRAQELGYWSWYQPSIALRHYETATGLSGIHQSDSLAVFRSRWLERLAREQVDYYSQDGLHGPFVRRMMALCQREYAQVARVIAGLALDTPAGQAEFLANHRAGETLDLLVERLEPDAADSADFHFFRAKWRLASGSREGALADLAVVAVSRNPSLRRDEARLLLELLDQPTGGTFQAFSPRLAALGPLMGTILAGEEPYPAGPDVPGRALLTRFLEMVLETLRFLPAARLSRIASFVEARQAWFANRAALIALMFRLAGLDFQGRGGHWFDLARGWIGERDWDPVKKAQFVINQASYLERLGRQQEALGLLRTVTEPLPRSLTASLHYHLGECLAGLGEPAGAEAHRRTSLDADPDNQALRRRIDGSSDN